MSTVGLTKAQDRELRFGLGDGRVNRRVVEQLQELGLVDFRFNVTPRGHAALAAPRMTQAELVMLERIENFGNVRGAVIKGTFSVYTKGWATLDHVNVLSELTPAGRTALNNVRAAMGSPDWKESV